MEHTFINFHTKQISLCQMNITYVVQKTHKNRVIVRVIISPFQTEWRICELMKSRMVI